MHDATNRAAAVERALRAANYLDALRTGGRQMGGVEGAAERVLRDAVNEDEGVVGFAATREQ